MIGKTLAHYEITALLGKGGMGEVYRALDTKLGRDVALKILPREVSGDPERGARFEREARTLASLQHANIASIYGYEEVGGVRFLAMELVEGEDLAQRLQRGRLSVDEALRMAQQIAVGLEAAHEKNIVHRDLKPANVKIDPDGVVKILDFGLARAYAGDAVDGQELDTSPTITAAMTQAGVILGTAAYMSPEQARGKAIDKRSDIWSFGVMLYEMLTGTQMYRGETVTDILGAIVHSTPDIDALPKDVPPALRRLLARCLTPNIQDRLRDIGEARYTLHHLDAVEPSSSSQTSGASSRGWMISSLILLAIALGLSALQVRSPKDSTPVIQGSIALPRDHSLVTIGSSGGSIRISPDGQSIAFVAQKEGRRQIWVRAFAEREGHPVQGAEGGHRPFWSPDGRSLGFFSEGSLRRVSVNGGAPLTIAPAADGRGAVWLPSGTIVFAPTPGSALFAVAAGGGEARQITDASKYPHREPRLLQGSERFLYLEDRSGGLWQIMVGSVDGSENPIDVGPTSGGVEFSNGQLLYLKGRTLVAQPFDTASYQLTGEPTPIAENIIRDSNFGIGVFSAGGKDILAYQTGGTGRQVLWFDREGNQMGEIDEAGTYSEITLSPDGKTIAVRAEEIDGKSDLWLVDVARGTRGRLTFTPDNVAKQRSGSVWSPDGSLLVFSVQYDGATSLYSKRTDGSGEEELVFEKPNYDAWSYDISPDGEWLLFGLEGSGSNEDLWVLSLSGTSEPRALFETPFDEWPGRFSPDGRWVLFTSNESGRFEVYVIHYPDGSGKWQVSRDGGRFGRWSRDGRELYYVNTEGALMSVSVDPTGNSFSAAEPQKLFQTNMLTGAFETYDIDSPNDRFLVLEQAGQDEPISLYLNWKAALEVR